MTIIVIVVVSILIVVIVIALSFAYCLCSRGARRENDYRQKHVRLEQHTLSTQQLEMNSM